MGILDRLERRDLSLTNDKAWDSSLWNFRGSQSLSGENVTETTALNYSAVFNAITLISGTIGSLPLHLMQKQGKNNTQATEEKLYKVLHTQYNKYMTAMTGRECMMSHILAWGNGYAEIVRDVYGDIVELWPIPPNRVYPKMKGNDLVYEIKMERESDIIMPREKILHIPGLGFDGFTGYSIIAMARKSIGLGMAMETFGSTYFGAGTHPGVIVSHPGKLKDPSNLRNALTASYSGLGQSHRLMLLEEGMKIEKVGIPPNDSQFLESRVFQTQEIARWFNIPVHKLKEMSKSSFNNIESEQMSFVSDTIRPWAVRLEQNYDTQLLTVQEQTKQKLYFKHNLEGLLRGNSKDRAEFYSKMFNIGGMTINEIRGKEDMNPVEGGDIHLVPLNMTTLTNAGKQSETAKLPGDEDNDNNGKNKESLGIPVQQ